MQTRTGFWHIALLIAAVTAAAMKGDVPVIWSGVAAFGVLSLLIGFYRVRHEGHGFKAGSFLWSVGAVAVCVYRLNHWNLSIGQIGWFGETITAFNYHFLRMLMVAWGVSNASNIALNLREVFRRRRPRLPRRPVFQPVQQTAGLLHRRKVTTAWVEEIEGQHVFGQSAAHRPAHIAPDLLEQLGDVPLIDLVPTGEGEFIPLDLPQREAVPVRRRR